MLYLRKKEIKDGIVYYYYQCEGEGEWGVVWISLDCKDWGCDKTAEGDPLEDWRYKGHAITRIKEYIKENRFPDKDLVAWG